MLLLSLLLTACGELFDTHPYDVNFHAATDINSRNISQAFRRYLDFFPGLMCYLPWSIDLKRGWSVEPLQASLYVNTVYGHEFSTERHPRPVARH